MPVTRCLHIDDDTKELQGRGSGRDLVDGFERCFPHAAIEVTSLSFEEGEDRLRQEPGAFDLLVVDILDDNNRTAGARIIGWARDRVECKAVIVAISNDADELKAVDAKADASIHKQFKGTDVVAHFASQLQAAYRAAQVEPSIAKAVDVKWDDQNLPLNAAVLEVGTANIQSLVTQVCGLAPKEICLGYVRPGLSGAVTVRCHCTFDNKDPRREFLLKVSRDRKATLDELAAWHSRTATTGLRFPKLVVPPQSQSSHNFEATSGGWFAIGIDYASGITLARWLTSDTPPGHHATDTDRIIKQIFVDGLAKVYKDSEQTEDERPSDSLHSTLLSPARQARVMLAVEECWPLAERHLSLAANRDVIVRFLRHRMIGNRDGSSLPLGTTTVLIHGDLHGGNALVTDGETLALLDPASTTRTHPAADWARLLVDIIFCGLGNTPECHEWSALERWVAMVENVVTYENVDDATTDLPTRCREAIRWLRSRGGLDVIFGKLGAGVPSEWELRLALAIELLRVIPRAQTTSMPLRVLAAVSAIAALDAAGNAAPAL